MIFQDKHPIIHLLAILLLFITGVGVFFGVYLPATTHHGESLTVPDLRGLSIAEVEEFLSHRDLTFVIADSGFSTDQALYTVLSQQPEAYAQVKIGRAIYLSINSKNAPLVEVPDILKASLKSAELVLESYGLRLGNVTYIPHPQSGRVLKAWVDSATLTSEVIQEGYQVRKNTAVHVAVGDGIGDVSIAVPKLVGRPADEVEIHLLGIGLHVGQLHWQTNLTVPAGTVIRQRPYYGERARKGQGIDLWVASGY